MTITLEQRHRDPQHGKGCHHEAAAEHRDEHGKGEAIGGQ